MRDEVGIASSVWSLEKRLVACTDDVAVANANPRNQNAPFFRVRPNGATPFHMKIIATAICGSEGHTQAMTILTYPGRS
jgi:hypothetical protein